MFDELGLRGRLCEHISRLVFGVDGMDSNIALIDVIPEVVVLDIDVFGAWMDLGNSDNLNCTAVSFKNGSTLLVWFCQA